MTSKKEDESIGDKGVSDKLPQASVERKHESALIEVRHLRDFYNMRPTPGIDARDKRKSSQVSDERTNSYVIQNVNYSVQLIEACRKTYVDILCFILDGFFLYDPISIPIILKKERP